MRPWRAAGALLAAQLAALPGAASMTMLDMPEALQLGEEKLVPASCGIRSTLWIEHYVSVLYLPGRRPSANELMDPGAAKVLRLKLASTRLIPHDIPRKWREPIARHLSREEYARAGSAYRTLRPGDIVTIAYAPGLGARLHFNERVVARTADHSLIDAILETWAGGDPLPQKLHRVMRRNPCPRGALADGVEVVRAG